MGVLSTSWVVLRVSRWLTWLVFLGYCMEFVVNRRDPSNSYGHLLPTTEMMMFGLPMLAIFLGYMELMMRERAGLERPTLTRLMAQRKAN